MHLWSIIYNYKYVRCSLQRRLVKSNTNHFVLLCINFDETIRKSPPLPSPNKWNVVHEVCALTAWSVQSVQRRAVQYSMMEYCCQPFRRTRTMQLNHCKWKKRWWRHLSSWWLNASVAALPDVHLQRLRRCITESTNVLDELYAELRLI